MMLLFPICSVHAEEWIFTPTIPDMDKDMIEIKEEKEYQWYQLSKEGDYYLESPGEEYIKTEFWTYSPWSSWSKEKKEAQYMETRSVYYYKELKKIKYIRIYDSKSEHMQFSTISVYKGRNKIDITESLVDGEMMIELGEPCYYDEIELEMSLINSVDQYNGFWVEWLYEKNELPAMSVYTLCSFKTVGRVNYRYRNLNENVRSYENEQQSLERIETNSHRVVREEQEYRYRERLDYYEKTVRNYYQEYSSVPVGEYVIPDLETEKVKLFYRLKEGKKEEPRVEIVETIKEVHDIVEVPVKETVIVEKPAIIKKESSAQFLQLKKELTEANATIASLKNEASKQLEVKQVNMKKQSFPLFLSIPFLFVGYLVGRIVTTKKKF